MRTMYARAAAAAAVVAMLGVTVAFAGQAAKVDVTGKWAFTVETAAGSGNPTLTMKQDGEKLTGHYSGQLGESDFTGTVKGNKIDIKFTIDVQGNNLEYVYDGTVDGKDTMKGKVSIVGLGDGTFTAKKQ
ncbi:MAG: hypothetical protein HY048_07640 [Acidobacteria bacterium]|nr:hypothetical protein [Acidobacteriota bacterium]